MKLQVLTGCALLCGSLLATPAATAGHPGKYNNGDLNGGYEVLLVAWTSPENVTNRGYLGVVQFDGVGQVSGNFTISTGGVTTTDSYSGTYAVNKDGTGSLSMTNGGSSTLQLALVIDGSGLKFLQTNPNGSTAVMNGTGTSQGGGSFSNASLKGTYGALETKWDTPSDPNSSEPDSTLGLYKFDGKGKITVSFTDEHKGQIAMTTGKGSYAVNSDGSGSADLTMSNAREVTFAFAIGSDGKSLQFLGTNCDCGNAVLAGTAIRQ